MRIPLNSTELTTSFQMVSKSSPSIGVDGLTVRARVAKGGGPFGDAASQVVLPQGDGFYALVGHQQDRNTIGELLVGGIVDDPGADVTCIVGKHEIFDPATEPVDGDQSQVVSLLQQLTTLTQRLVAAERA